MFKNSSCMPWAPFHQDVCSGQEKQYTCSSGTNTSPAQVTVTFSCNLTPQIIFPPWLNLLEAHTGSSQLSKLPTKKPPLLEQTQCHKWVCLFPCEEKSTSVFPSTSLCVVQWAYHPRKIWEWFFFWIRPGLLADPLVLTSLGLAKFVSQCFQGSLPNALNVVFSSPL